MIKEDIKDTRSIANALSSLCYGASKFFARVVLATIPRDSQLCFGESKRLKISERKRKREREGRGKKEEESMFNGGNLYVVARTESQRYRIADSYGFHPRLIYHRRPRSIR